MKSDFAGNLFTNRLQNHIFSSNSEDLEAVGLHSFTLDSCSNIWNTSLDIINLLTQKSYSKLEPQTTFLPDGLQGEFILYDELTNSYQRIIKLYDEWREYILYYEKRKLGLSDADPIYDGIINAVKRSGNGVLFLYPRTLFSSYIPPPEEEQAIRIVLKFFDRQLDDDNDKDSRTVGISSSTRFVGIPSTPAGYKYSYSAQQESAYSLYEPAKFPALYDGREDNPKNVVAASLDLVYNPTEAAWSAGSHRIMAILLEDIEAAPLKNVEIDKGTYSTLSQRDFFDNASTTQTSYVAPTGLAMPLSVHNKHRNQFGPNFIRVCKNGEVTFEPETVIATNRFKKSYKQSETVFLTKVGKDWIIEGQPQDELSPSLQINDWAFCKLIANSDHYFKRNFFWENGIDRDSILPGDYEAHMAAVFYNNDTNVLQSRAEYELDYFPTVTINGEIISPATNLLDHTSPIRFGFDPSNGYYVASIYDQLPPDIGGNNHSFISKTNVYTSENKGIDGIPDAEEIGVFWGPVYIDGYNNIKKVTNYETSDDAKYLYDKKYLGGIGPFSNNPQNYLLKTKNLTGYDPTLFENQGNNEPQENIYIPTINDIPAELTSKIIPLYGYKEEPERFYDFLLTPNPNRVFYPKSPYFDSVKKSKNNIQFIPLTADLVGHNDINAINQTIWNKNFKTNIATYFTNYYETDKKPENLWGFMFDRLALETISQSIKVGSNPSICGGKYSGIELFNLGMVAYDCYIHQSPTNSPVGTPRGMFDDNFLGANCVGIICGKNTIRKNLGGSLTFEVTSKFGSNPFRTATAGESGPPTIIPFFGLFIPIANSSAPQNGIPQFGSKTDRIDSFGTTALFVRIFDSWPEHLTYFDPRYFGVLHWNEGIRFSIPNFDQITVVETQIDDNKDIVEVEITVPVDKIETNVDFRIPTYFNGDIIPPDTIIKQTTNLAPKDRWRVNPIRRGALLTQTGFTYIQTKIGIVDYGLVFKKGFYIDTSVSPPVEYSDYLFIGKGYEVGEEYNIKNGSKIKITKVNKNGSITDYEIIDQGEFDSNLFPFEVTLPIPKDTNGNVKSGAQSAIIVAEVGVTYPVKKIDFAPKEQVTSTRISASSRSGQEKIDDEVTISTFSLDQNSTGYYDIFTHFHNDITHTLWAFPYTYKEQLQYINMKIT